MAFATVDDVQSRLGRDLTTAERDTADFLLEGATALITDEVGKDEDWEPDPIPRVLTIVCVEIATRAMRNPDGVAAKQEQLGAYSHSTTYARDVGMALTDSEARLCRYAVYGSSSGSSTPRSVVDRVIDLREGRDVDEEPEE